MLSLVQPTQSETHTHACVDDTRGVCEEFPKVTLMANREAKKERKKEVRVPDYNNNNNKNKIHRRVEERKSIC